MAAKARVSVVIATFQRPELLAEALEGVRDQTMTDWELIVVDDGSTDHTRDLLNDIPCQVVRTERVGPGRARERGWRTSTAPIVAFTDDDCRPTPTWLEQLIRPIENGEADFVQGCTVPRPDQLDRLGPWSRTQEIRSETGRYQTCNMAYRRDVLESLDGFDPGYEGRFTSGEDTDLAWRAKEAGWRVVFNGEAVVEHVVWPSDYWKFLKDRRRWGMVVRTVGRHPELRRYAYHHYFFRPSHLRMVVGVPALGLLWLVRRWLPLAAVAAVAGAVLVADEDRPQHLVHLTKVAIVDAYEVFVFVGASFRYRTVLL